MTDKLDKIADIVNKYYPQNEPWIPAQEWIKVMENSVYSPEYWMDKVLIDIDSKYSKMMEEILIELKPEINSPLWKTMKEEQ